MYGIKLYCGVRLRYKGRREYIGKNCFRGLGRIYASTDNIIATSAYYDEKTQIARFEISDGKVELKATGEIKGYLLNQFSIDEYKGHFRFVLTETSANGGTQNSLVILDGNLKETGKIENIAKNERVYSARFMGMWLTLSPSVRLTRFSVWM